jgi:putative transposase
MAECPKTAPGNRRRLRTVIPVQLFVASLFGWLQHEQHEIILYLREENRVLKAQLRHRRLRLTDNDRRRLAALERLGRRVLAQVATVVTPDTILRWHRHLIARKWTYSKRRPGRPGVLPEIRRLVVRMATENPRWGYTRIQGALKNLNHRVARSTIATILKAQGIPPSGPLRGRHSCGRIGTRWWPRTSSQRKSGPFAAWSPITRCL